MKYNKKTSVNRRTNSELAARPDATANMEGGLAFDANDKTRLVLQTLTCLVNEPKFYGGRKKTTHDVIDLAGKVAAEDPQFVINLAKVARKEFYLRSVPIVLMATLAKHVKGREGMHRDFTNIISRADELSESLAAYQAIFEKRPIPNSLKKGVAGAFAKFDEYQFAKYDKPRDLSLKDALRIVIGFIKESDEERRALYQKILEEKLAVEKTWEMETTVKGSNKETWSEILPKMGYMAVIRNIRNFEKHDVDLDKVAAKIDNKKAVLKSKQFPYRFYSAYQHAGSGQIKTALSKAINYSVENVPKLKGKTVIALDSSGSMGCGVSSKSNVKCYELANLLGAMAMKFCDNPLIFMFDSRLRKVELNSEDSILTNHGKLNRLFGGGATYAHLLPDHLMEKEIKVDRMILLSDMQCYGRNTMWGGADRSLPASWKQYKRRFNPNAVMYSVDLTGYGTLQFPANDASVVKIAGWSDKVFKFIGRYEAGPDQLIEYIERYGQDE